MANKIREAIGVKLKLDGLKQIRKQLKTVGDQLSKTADKASRPFRKAGQTIQRSFSKAATSASRSLVKVGSAAGRMSASVARAGAKAGAALGRGITSGVRTATAQLGKLKTAATAVTVGLGATLYGVTETARGVQQQARLAKTSGTTIEKFSALAAVTSQFGMDIEDLSGAMADLSEKMFEASQGDEGLNKLFDRVGIKVTDNNGRLRDTADVFKEIPAALRRIGTQSERSAIATKLIAGDSEKLASILALTNKELKSRERLAKQTGQIVDEKQIRASQRFLDSWYALKSVFTGLFKQVSLRLYPVFGKAFGTLRKLLLENQKIIVGKFAGGVTRLVELLTKLAKAVFEIGGTQASGAGGFGAFVDLVQAAFKATGLLVERWGGVGKKVADGLGAGIVALRDFSAAFLVASGDSEAAGRLFGRKLSKGRGTFADRKVTKSGIQDLGGRQYVDEGYALDFDIDQGTFNAASGFAGAIDSMVARFGRISSFIQSNVVPAIRDIFAAMTGNDAAVRRLVGHIDNLLSMTPALQDFWYLVSGRGYKVDPNGFIGQTIRQMQNLRKESDFIDALYALMTGGNARGDNWFVRQFQEIREAAGIIGEALAPIRQKLAEFQEFLFGDNKYVQAAGTFALLVALKNMAGAIAALNPPLLLIAGSIAGIVALIETMPAVVDAVNRALDKSPLLKNFLGVTTEADASRDIADAQSEDATVRAGVRDRLFERAGLQDMNIFQRGAYNLGQLTGLGTRITAPEINRNAALAAAANGGVPVPALASAAGNVIGSGAPLARMEVTVNGGEAATVFAPQDTIKSIETQISAAKRRGF